MPGMDQTDPPLSPLFTPAMLPEPLPADPFPLLVAWLEEAHRRRVQPNPHAVALATVDADGTPSVRMVLCKGIDPAAGMVVFYTNYLSRKSMALETNPRAALAFHWDALDRQVRIEGPVVRSPAAESDAYFASRPAASRIGAWASEQSRPIPSRAAMLARVEETLRRFGVMALDLVNPAAKVEIPRPPHWGGWRVYAQRVEMWVGGTGRVHDRAEWVRPLTQTDEHTYAPGGPWAATRMQP